jgi:hypothetical protein
MGQWGFFFVRGAPVAPAKGVKNLGIKFCFGIVRPGDSTILVHFHKFASDALGRPRFRYRCHRSF